jgi:hypothetical protein
MTERKWSSCVNNHLFTIDESGDATEQAQCPQCGAQVGRTNHRAVDGVSGAEALDDAFAVMQV